MTGEFYINGKDIFDTYGAFVMKDGHNGLLSYPALKKVDTNDWPEEDGIEADLTLPVLEGRDFVMPFGFVGSEGDFSAFCGLLENSAYIDAVILGRNYRLRLRSYSDITQVNGNLYSFSVRFADDFPLYGYEYISPVSDLGIRGQYELDGVDFGTYGIRVVDDHISEDLGRPDIKEALKRNLDTIGGCIYDGGAQVRRKGRDMTLNCYMEADSLPGLWRNYDAFLHDWVRADMGRADITQRGLRVLTTSASDRRMQCYYRSSQVKEFVPVDGGAWILFSMTFTIVADNL